MESKYRVIYRVWHWLMALSVIGLLLTVLLRKTFLSYKSNALIIQEKLEAINIDITLESAKLIGKAIRAPMWEWHYIFGSILALSLIIHIYMLLTKQMRFPLLKLLSATNFEERIKQSVYLLIFLGIVLMSITGGLIYFQQNLGISKETAHALKEFHESLLFPIVTVIVMHFMGVVRHEIKTKEGIVSKMIHGEH